MTEGDREMDVRDYVKEQKQEITGELYARMVIV